MINRVWKSVHSSVRYKLLVLVLVPLLIILPLILSVTLYWFYKHTYRQLYAKVSTDMSVADDVFQRLQEGYLNQLEKLVESHFFLTAYRNDDHERIEEQLELMIRTTDFDYMRITSRGMSGYDSVPSPLLEDAWHLAKPSVGIQLMVGDAFKDADPELAERALMPLINTPHAAPTSRTFENRAMMIRVVYPIRDLFGDVVAVMDGGVMLNRNFSFVDEIRDLVYGEGSLPEGGWGTVTVYLDDVRISTNVPLQEGERALGTRVSNDVRNHVLGKGKAWVDREFVVNDWYISAYKPISDVFGDQIGMLYTGFLESPYSAAYLRAATVLSVLILLTGLIIGWIVVRGAKSIFHPIELMTEVARLTRRGEEKRIGEVYSRDEIGELASQFDSMLNELKERSREIENAAGKLEREVESRTKELENKNEWLQETVTLLRETKQQLTIAGKLAALGQLTAGVAHEINNPTAVILGNVDVLIKELGEDTNSVQTEIDLIIEQVYRIRSIVDKLLQYARPIEITGYVDEIDVNELIETTFHLVDHELSAKSIHIEKHFGASNKVKINPQELQQVLVNLLMNAVQALPDQGAIDCVTENTSDGVVIIVKDYGVGIAAGDLVHVFDPFYTRKPEGTGLGLSVSYSLVQRYGGEITVDSDEGQWTEFKVRLLKEPVIEETEKLLRSYG